MCPHGGLADKSLAARCGKNKKCKAKAPGRVQAGRVQAGGYLVHHGVRGMGIGVFALPA